MDAVDVSVQVKFVFEAFTTPCVWAGEAEGGRVGGVNFLAVCGLHMSSQVVFVLKAFTTAGMWAGEGGWGVGVESLDVFV